MAAILICAFPGLGKTYLYQQYKDRLKILDLNTGRFEGDDFPGNYIAEVEKRLNDYDLILLSSDRNVRYALNDAGLDFDLFYPSKDRKNELIEIYVTNRKNRDFIMNLDHNFNGLIDEIEDEDLEHCFKHKIDKPHRFIAQYDLLKDFLNSSLEMNGNKPVEKSSIEGDGYKEKETPQADEDDLAEDAEEDDDIDTQANDDEIVNESPQSSKLYEDFQLKNITSLIDKCRNIIILNMEKDKDIPEKFENITITSDEYNALLYVRKKIQSLI